MKYWQKIYLSTLALFLLICGGCIYMILHSIYGYNLNQEAKAAARDARFILSDLERDLRALGERDKLNEDTVNSLVDNYQLRYGRKDNFFQLILEDVVFGNELAGGFRPDTGSGTVSFVEIDGEKYTCADIEMNEPLQDYRFLYFHKLTDMDRQWRVLDRRIVWINIVSSAILVILLSVLSRTLVHPLEKLSATAREIASGSYDSRLKADGKDEIAQLSRDFNYMAGQIGDRIREAEQENMYKQQFIDNLSHEMRTPLATIFGYAELMRNADIDAEEQQEALAQIMQESSGLLELREKLMSLILLREDKEDKEMTALAPLFDRIRRELTITMKDRNVRLETVLNAEAVYANPALLQSLLVNLVQNAVHACKAEVGVVRLEAEQEERGIRLRVADNGKGMEPGQLTRIMEPFYRVDKARSRKDGGAGLGLTLCRQICVNQEARLTFASEPGRGTQAELFFPAPS